MLFFLNLFPRLFHISILRDIGTASNVEEKLREGGMESGMNNIHPRSEVFTPSCHIRTDIQRIERFVKDLPDRVIELYCLVGGDTLLVQRTFRPDPEVGGVLEVSRCPSDRQQDVAVAYMELSVSLSGCSGGREYQDVRAVMAYKHKAYGSI